MKSFVYALIALMLSGAVLTACDTMQGAGQDIKHGGQDLSNAAQDNK
jgi:predicted small secreted protein